MMIRVQDQKQEKKPKKKEKIGQFVKNYLNYFII